MRTRTLSVAALLVAAGLAFAVTSARAGTPNATKDGVNERGETYGIMRTRDPQPDLVAAVGEDWNGQAAEGYVRRGDLWRSDLPSTPAEALQWQARDHGRDVPVYDADGVTVVGSFHVTGAAEAGPTTPVPAR